MRKSLSLLSANIEVVLGKRPLPGQAVSKENFIVQRSEPRSCPSPFTDGCSNPNIELIQTLYLSVDPFLRCRFNAETGVQYTHPYQLNERITSAGIGMDANGTLFLDAFDSWPWAQWVSRESGMSEIPVLTEILFPVSSFLGVIGTTGLTAYLGVVDHGAVGRGDVLVVSGAGGATGHIAGQIAKQRGFLIFDDRFIFFLYFFLFFFF
jgi:prostaglandin reductase 2